MAETKPDEKTTESGALTPGAGEKAEAVASNNEPSTPAPSDKKVKRKHTDLQVGPDDEVKFDPTISRPPRPHKVRGTAG